MRRSANVLGVVVCVALWVGVSRVGAATVDVTKIGTPAWNLVDFHLVAAPVGTAADNYAGFFTLTGDKLLPPPFYKNYPGVGAGPSGVEHQPPYDKDLANGITAQGLTEQSVFPISDFSNGRAPLLAFMIVADGSTTGSSPDFASGPIIPNSLFPMNFSIADKKNGVDFSDPGSFPVPSHTTLDPAFANDEGTSHVPFFVFDNADFAKDKNAPLAGSYQYEVKVVDSSGAGYNVVAPFTVTGGPTAIPLPAAVWPGFALLGALPIERKLRRK